jgi:outer membrane protein TolC
MKHFALVIIFAALVLVPVELKSQQTQVLSLSEVLSLAVEQSPDAILAKHQFRASYWQFRTFKAEYLPSLTLTGTLPDYNRVFEKEYDFSTGQDSYVEKQTNNSSLSMALSQNIGLTGGNIFVQSDIRRFDVIGDNGSNQYISTPVSIGLTQPLFRYNEFKWQKQIEPMRYEEAMKTYLDNMENVNLRAVQRFFQLALSQINREIAVMNYSNSDTLYRIAQGRYNLGTIAEDELLQMELTFLNAGTALNESEINLRDMELRLRSFLGYNENIKIELEIPTEIPTFEIRMEDALELATANNPEIISLNRQLIEARRNVAQAKAEKGLNANLTASYGLQGQAVDIPGAYQSPDDQQRVRIGFTVPIVDWGLGRGRFRMAQSSEEVVKTQVQQSIIDFEQSIFLDVAQFNLQDDQVRIAAKSDTVAQRMYEVTKQRFLIGRIDVLELNNADTKKDTNKRAFIQALQNYWTYYYNIRRLTLYDFERGVMLDADYEKLIE